MDLKPLSKIGYGMYVIGSSHNGKDNLMIANVVSQVSSEPKIVCISINKKLLTHELIEKGKMFSISILDINADMKIIMDLGFKSGKQLEKTTITNCQVVDGVPVMLDDVCAYMVAKLVNSVDCGSHTVFFGEITDSKMCNDKKAMSYEDYKAQKGVTPIVSPTFYIERKGKNE